MSPKLLRKYLESAVILPVNTETTSPLPQWRQALHPLQAEASATQLANSLIKDIDVSRCQGLQQRHRVGQMTTVHLVLQHSKQQRLSVAGDTSPQHLPYCQDAPQVLQSIYLGRRQSKPENYRHFSHLTQKADSLQETLMLGKTEGRRRRGRQRMRWWDGITDRSLRDPPAGPRCVGARRSGDRGGGKQRSQ